MTNGGDSKATKGIELGRASHKGRKVRWRIGRVDMESVLKFEGKGVEKLSDQIEAPDGDVGWKKRNKVRVRSKHFIRLHGHPGARSRMAR